MLNRVEKEFNEQRVRLKTKRCVVSASVEPQVRLKSWEGGVGATAEDLLQKIQTLLTAIFRL